MLVDEISNPPNSGDKPGVVLKSGIPDFDIYATAASRAAQRRPCRTVAAIIHATPIRRDAEGRYCLNDLHKAAGSQERHKPGDFIRQLAIQELIEEISNCGDSRIKPVELSRGRYGGTYVVEDLALTYAMWISPRFHLEVLRPPPKHHMW